MESNRPRDDGDRGLDRLLGETKWPQPSVEQIARLRGQWLALRRRRRARLASSAATIAAGLLVVTGAILWRAARSPNEPVVVAKQEVTQHQPADRPRVDVAHSAPPSPGDTIASAQQPAPRPAAQASAEDAAPEPPRDALESREPNLYERVVMAGRVPVPKKRRMRQTDKQREAFLDQMIDKLVDRPDADVAEPLAMIADATDRWEPLVWNKVRRSSGAQRIGAARLLARVATFRSLPLLAELAGDAATRAVAMEGLARLGSPLEVAHLAAREPDAALRRQLLAALAARGTEESVGLYLNFVRQAETRADALDALARVASPPATVLLAYLRAPQVATRQAAAQALGRIADPEVAQRLAATLGDAGSRQEALVALLLNPSPQAVALVNEARQNLYLVATVRAAELELDSLTDTPGR